jgi:hypothetical protein
MCECGNSKKNTQKIVFYAVLGHLGTPKTTQKSTQRPANEQVVLSQCLRLKKAPNQINRPILVG